MLLLFLFTFWIPGGRFRDRRDPTDRGWEAMQKCYPAPTEPLAARNARGLVELGPLVATRRQGDQSVTTRRRHHHDTCTLTAPGRRWRSSARARAHYRRVHTFCTFRRRAAALREGSPHDTTLRIPSECRRQSHRCHIKHCTEPRIICHGGRDCISSRLGVSPDLT